MTERKTTTARLIVCLKNPHSCFLQFVAKRYMLQQVSEGTNRNVLARNMQCNF